MDGEHSQPNDDEKARIGCRVCTFSGCFFCLTGFLLVLSSSFATEAINAAAEQGLKVAANELFSALDEASMDFAMSKVKAAGARIVLAVIFDSNTLDLVRSARKLGMLGSGYIWWMASLPGLADVVTAVTDRAERQALIQAVEGWFSLEVDALSSNADRLRLYDALKDEPIANLQRIGGDVVLITAEMLEREPPTTYCVSTHSAFFFLLLLRVVSCFVG